MFRSVSFSGNGGRLAGGDVNGVIIVYDFSAGYEVFRVQSQGASRVDARACVVRFCASVDPPPPIGCPGAVLGVNLSFSGQRLATCGSKKIQVFHVQSGAPIYEKASTDRPRAVKLSLDGKRVAAGIDGKLQVRRIDDGAHYHTFDKIASRASTISIDRGSTIFAMGCEDGKLAVFDLNALDETGSPRWTAELEKKVCAAVSPDGAFVAAGDHADAVCVYAAKSGALLWSKTSWGDALGPPFTSGLSFAGDSSMLAIGRWNACAYLLDTQTWTIVASVKRKDSVYSVSLDHLGKRMGISGRDKKAQVFTVDVERSAEYRAGCRPSAKLELIFSAQLDCIVNAVALTRDGKILAAGCVDALVYIYLVNTKIMSHIIPHGGSVLSVAFSLDDNHLAVGGEHNSVNVWGMSEDGPPDQVLALPRQGRITSVAFSSACLCFVSGALATIYGNGNEHRDYEVKRRE